MPTCTHWETCRRTHIAALFTAMKQQKQPKSHLMKNSPIHQGIGKKDTSSLRYNHDGMLCVNFGIQRGRPKESVQVIC